MIADVTAADFGLISVGAGIGLLSGLAVAYFTHRWSKSQRAVERVAEAYGEWIPACEQMLRFSHGFAIHRLSIVKSGEQSVEGLFAKLLLREFENEQGAMAQEGAAFVRLLMFEPSLEIREQVSAAHYAARDAGKEMSNAPSNDVANEIHARALESLSHVFNTLEGRFAK